MVAEGVHSLTNAIWFGREEKATGMAVSLHADTLIDVHSERDHDTPEKARAREREREEGGWEEGNAKQSIGRVEQWS